MNKISNYFFELIDRLNRQLNLDKEKQHLLKFLTIIHLCFFVFKVCLGDFFLADSYEYFNLAENIKNSFEFYSGDLNSTISFENYTKRPPLYGVFILIFSFLLKSNISVLIVQNILSILSVFLCLKIFEYYYKPLEKRNILYLFLLTSISQFIYSNYLMSEILSQFLIVMLCYSFHNITIKRKLSYLLYFQIIVILLFLTKPIFYLFVIPNILLGVWFTKYIKRAYLMSLIPITVCALYMSWNYQRTGVYDFSSIQNINLKNYNLYYFKIDKYGEEYAKNIDSEISKIISRKNTYAEQQKAIKDLSLEYIKSDFFSYTLSHIKGSIRMFIDPGRFDIYNYFELENNDEVGFLHHLNKNGINGAFSYFKSQPIIILILIPVILLLNFFKIIGFIMFWLKNHKNIMPVFWFMLLIIFYLVSLSGTVGASRYMVPILPLYLYISIIGYSKKPVINKKLPDYWKL